jgi:hypothetical protein
MFPAISKNEMLSNFTNGLLCVMPSDVDEGRELQEAVKHKINLMKK